MSSGLTGPHIRERQEAVAGRLEMMERIDPEGARLIREELSFWHQRSMTQAETIQRLQRINLLRTIEHPERLEEEMSLAERIEG